MDATRFREACLQIGIGLNDEQLHAFETFEDNLYKANEVMNLTRVPKEECWLRHFVDSLLIHEFILESSDVLDIGTGPGFPAWPLACARQDLTVTPLDSSNKMLGFLRKNALPNLKIINARAEEWGTRESFDVVTGRALAPLAAQLELSAAPAKIGGLVIPMRSAKEGPEIEKLDVRFLGLRLLRVEERLLPMSDIVRAFPLYEKVGPTSTKYPRKWADIRKG